jgi:hypothetical protein
MSTPCIVLRNMTKKKSNIEQHKEKDLNLGRDELLKIINADAPNATAVKNKIEAIKLLARMHKGLQVDKTVVNTKVETLQAQALAKPELKPELKATLKNLLNAPGN